MNSSQGMFSEKNMSRSQSMSNLANGRYLNQLTCKPVAHTTNFLFPHNYLPPPKSLTTKRKVVRAV